MIFTADLSRLVRAMRDADLTEDEKKDAREKLGEFLKTPAGVTLLREGVPELLGEMGLKWGIMV